MFNIFEDKDDYIAEKRPFHGKLPIDVSEVYDWNRHMELLDTHPESGLDTNTNKLRIGLNSFHSRPSAPQFARDIEQEMQDTFAIRNHITNIAFTGFGPNSDSYPRHADQMDVFLVQVIGEIQIQIEGLHDDAPVPFKPGDYYWIPRGTYHQIFPTTSRVSFSFGVEGDPDPSLYF